MSIFKIGFYGLMFFTVLGNSSEACLQKGRVLSIDQKRHELIATLDNGFQLKTATGSIYERMFEGSRISGTELCISNLYPDQSNPLQGYPSQVVAEIRLEGMRASDSSQECVKKGFIKRAVTNLNYDWFYFQDGFVARVVHVSKVTPILFEATFSKKEVCITKMDLSGSGPTWGIPRKVDLIGD